MVDQLVIRGAREHNLRNISLDLPRDRLIVFTGLSGSGKSSLAFDTIYAEGQRRYVESLSAYARQFLGQMDKPDVDFIEGLSPAISIDQKSASRNPRSTVGTITEVYDYLRLLYARIGVPHCPHDGTVITRQTPAADRRPRPRAARGHPLPGAGPGGAGPQGQLRDACWPTSPPRATPGPASTARCTSSPSKVDLARYEQHTIEVVIDRLVSREGIERRLTDSLETALRLADGVAEVQLVPRDGRRRREEREAHLQPAPGLPTCGRQLRGAGAPQLLVQLALRRLRALRRPGHPLRGRPRAGRAQPRPRPSREGAIQPWAGGHASTSTGCSRRWRGARRSRPTSPGASSPQKQRNVLLHGKGVGRVHVKYKNRYGRVRSYHAQVRGRGAVPPAAPPGQPRATASASRSRATCARCPAPSAAAPG